MTKIDYKYAFSIALISKTFKNTMLSYFLVSLKMIQMLYQFKPEKTNKNLRVD